MKNNRVKISGSKALEKQFNDARGKSRGVAKKSGQDRYMIFSDRSLEIHKQNWERFSDWLGENKKTARLGQIKREDVKEYIEKLNEQGLSKKTLQARISAINKVMGKRWDSELDENGNKIEKPTLTNMGIKVEKTDENSYKHLTAEEWKKENFEKYENYQNTYDTVSAFGLRKNELKELNERSFLIDEKNNKIYIQTIGKGGKYRIAECTEKMNEKMIELYGDKANRVNGVKVVKNAKRELERDINGRSERLNLKGSKSNQHSWHIFRSEYAKTLLNEKIEHYDRKFKYKQGYSTINVIKQENDLKDIHTQIGAFKGSAMAFVEVSRNLGHNRLDVMLRYI